MVIDFLNVVKRYNIKTNYIVHAGAHAGQELEIYDKVNPKEVWLFEPQTSVFVQLEQKIKKYNWAKAFNMGLGSKKELKKMYISEGNEGQSSSFLKPSLHIQRFPFVKFKNEPSEEACIIPLDNLVNNNKNFNPTILCMDTQGYEMEILKGSINTLNNHICMIVTEFATESLYEGCPTLKELDNFLYPLGYKREITKWQGSFWGDAVYISL